MAQTKKFLLKNSEITIVIKKQGAELCSLRTVEREYIWQANPKFWARHAPVLFPIVGRLVDNEFIHKGNTYTLHQHGFARDSEFEVKERSENRITLVLSANPDTKKLYPFDFELETEYISNGKSLTIRYKVSNPSDTDCLYFSIGAHPAFNCPFDVGQKRNEYELVFDREETPNTEMIENGLRINKNEAIFNEKGKLAIADNLFDHDALIFAPNPFSKVTFFHLPSQKEYLEVAFKNFPYLGIWSSHREAPFVCIEPWQGITDNAHHNKQLAQKEGIIALRPDKTFSCEYDVTVLL